MITKRWVLGCLILSIFGGFTYDDIEVKRFDNGTVTISKRDGTVLWTQDGKVRVNSRSKSIDGELEDIFIQDGTIYFVYLNYEDELKSGKDFLCKISERKSAETPLPGHDSQRDTRLIGNLAGGRIAVIRDYRFGQKNFCIVDADSLAIVNEYQGDNFTISPDRKSVAYLCSTMGYAFMWQNVAIDGVWIYPMQHVGYIGYEQYRSRKIDDYGKYGINRGPYNVDIVESCKVHVMTPLRWMKTAEGREGVSFFVQYGMTGEVRAVFAYLDKRREPHALESQVIEMRQPFRNDIKEIPGFTVPDDFRGFEIESWIGSTVTYKPIIQAWEHLPPAESRTVELQWREYEN